MISMLDSGLIVDGLITHEFSYENYEEAIAIIKSGKSGKIILNWDK